MKKTLSIVLILAMLMVVLAGCGQTDAPQAGTPTDGATQTETGGKGLVGGGGLLLEICLRFSKRGLQAFGSGFQLSLRFVGQAFGGKRVHVVVHSLLGVVHSRQLWLLG